MRNEQPQEEWCRQHELFQAALELPPDERAEFLAAECAGSPLLREEVEALLEASEAADPWIEHSAELIRRAARQAFTDDGDEAREQKEDATQGQRIGPYRIVRQVARGGMGTVYLAERADGQFEQRVALKLLRRGLDTDDILARFLAERQILASLAHPNIACLFDGGATEDGRPYLILEYVEGVFITDYYDARHLTIEQRLALFTTVCRAVQHAHSNHVLHRDLKPSNILVTEDGRVNLLDFGIAKLLDDSIESPRTRTGMRLLTPEYASPEQLCGGAVTAASDVYQLGMLLYELLSGRRPYQAEGHFAAEVERIVCREEVLAPSRQIARSEIGWQRSRSDAEAEAIARARSTARLRLRRTLRGDLDAITLKALRKEPEERYASAEALIEELERYRRGLAVQARRGTLGYRARKLVRRNRAALTALSGVAVGLLALAGWLGSALSGGQRGEVTTRLLVAHRLYEEGVRAYYDGDNRAAQRFLTAALAEDSAFAMAAYYRALTNREIDQAAFRADLDRAYRFAGRASERTGC